VLFGRERLQVFGKALKRAVRNACEEVVALPPQALQQTAI
jgi:hypothetical protein